MQLLPAASVLAVTPVLWFPDWPVAASAAAATAPLAPAVVFFRRPRRHLLRRTGTLTVRRGDQVWQ